MLIRKAKHSDVADICTLWCEFMNFHAAYDPCYTISANGADVFGKFVDEQISSRNALVLVAKDKNGLVGYLLAKIENRPPVFKLRRIGVIYDLAVTEHKRNTGVGTLLYQRSLEWFKKRNITRVELTVATTNPVSTRFWEKQGFVPYYERRFKDINAQT